jgi:hypothetical protein
MVHSVRSFCESPPAACAHQNASVATRATEATERHVLGTSHALPLSFFSNPAHAHPEGTTGRSIKFSFLFRVASA